MKKRWTLLALLLVLSLIGYERATKDSRRIREHAEHHLSCAEVDVHLSNHVDDSDVYRAVGCGRTRIIWLNDGQITKSFFGY
jgi:hypothetical protein